MNFLNRIGPGVDADFAQRAIERHHAGEDFLRERAALLDFLEDALVNQIVKLRHDGKSRDIALAAEPAAVRWC